MSADKIIPDAELTENPYTQPSTGEGQAQEPPASVPGEGQEAAKVATEGQVYVEPLKDVVAPRTYSRPATRPMPSQQGIDRSLGITLVGLGFFLLIGTAFNIRLWPLMWPFIYILPGVILFNVALKAKGDFSEPLAITSSIITMLGLIFLYQSITGHWQSWAYIWSLIAPTSIGLGEIIYGIRKGQAYTVQIGKTLVKIGLAIFLVGFVFFEMIIRISGFGMGRFGWPVLLILLGLLALFRNLLPGGRK
ncbi:MAG: hypothetical protein MUO64_01880 [Anaerolineales bacterium]|nr:hypothetical protein [Anaerolineales bacterium]